MASSAQVVGREDADSQRGPGEAVDEGDSEQTESPQIADASLPRRPRESLLLVVRVHHGRHSRSRQLTRRRTTGAPQWQGYGTLRFWSLMAARLVVADDILS